MNWQVGDLLRYEGRNGIAFGIVYKVRPSNDNLKRKEFHVIWLDDDQPTTETEGNDHSCIINMSRE